MVWTGQVDRICYGLSLSGRVHGLWSEWITLRAQHTADVRRDESKHSHASCGSNTRPDVHSLSLFCESAHQPSQISIRGSKYWIVRNLGYWLLIIELKLIRSHAGSVRKHLTIQYTLCGNPFSGSKSRIIIVKLFWSSIKRKVYINYI